MDPVSDPEYNIKQIIKQSLLLEDHLIERSKRCKDCIAKHFLTIIALSEEALSLAGTNTRKYPFIGDNQCFYDDLFEKWLKAKTDHRNQLYIAEQIRKHRKQLMAYYILNE